LLLLRLLLLLPLVAKTRVILLRTIYLHRDSI